MSMSLRLRAVCSRPATSSPHAFDDQPLDVEEQVPTQLPSYFTGAADLVRRDAASSASRIARCVVASRHDAPRREHRQMGVVNRDERARAKQLLFGVLEVPVEDVAFTRSNARGQEHECAGFRVLGSSAGSVRKPEPRKLAPRTPTR